MTRDVEEYLEWERSQTSTWNWIKKNLQPVHMFAIVIIMFFAWYLLENDKVNPNMVLGGVVLVIILIIYKGKKAEERKPIPINVMQALCLRHLKREIGRSYPRGTLFFPLGRFRMRFQGNWGEKYSPWKWEIGFRLIYPDGLRKDILYIADTWDGIITGAVEKPMGYTGQESTDLKVLLPMQLVSKEEKEPKTT